MPSYAPDQYLYLEANLSTGPTGYTRLYGSGNKSNFVEFETPPPDGSGPWQVDQIAEFFVPINARLYFSDYPAPLPPGPIQPFDPRVKRPLMPPSMNYIGNDGTTLTPTKNRSGGVTGFSGTAKTGDKYGLSVSSSIGNGKGRQPKVQVSWLSTVMSITKNADVPLTFGFNYSPTAEWFTVFLSRGNVGTAILVDLNDAYALGGVAALTRTIRYYDYVYATQNVTMPVTSSKPGMYLPSLAALWPFSDRVEYFAPAISLIASRTTPKLPPLSKPTPLAAFGALEEFSSSIVPSTSSADLLAAMMALIAPALGPLAGEFVSPHETSFGALQDAALWMGWLLVMGSGEQSFIQEASDYYKYLQFLISSGFTPGTGLNMTQKPIELGIDGKPKPDNDGK